MKLSSFLVIKAIVCLVFGIGFTLIPIAVMSVYGASLDTAGEYMSRLFGAVFIGIGLICWLCKSTDSIALKGITLALCIADTIGFIVALSYQLSGFMNALGWINVALWLLFALGLGYFRFIKLSTT